ncbi:MAG: GNAT family N-acetyltransferase, partial [Bacilli bacterium]|nr:GNAT family N-acetyltransferase [Bacilli bacterium]
MRHQFVSFPLKLYKDNPYFVPPLYGDEMKIFSKKNAYYKTSISSFFLAFDGDKVVGRISGIIQSQSNQKTGEKRARFTRFDAVDSQEVASLLFKAVEQWAIDNGMEYICGPLGY